MFKILLSTIQNIGTFKLSESRKQKAESNSAFRSRKAGELSAFLLLFENSQLPFFIYLGCQSRQTTKQSLLIYIKHTFRVLLPCFWKAGLLSAFLLPESKIAFCFPTFLLLFENSQLSFFIYLGRWRRRTAKQSLLIYIKHTFRALLSFFLTLEQTNH